MDLKKLSIFRMMTDKMDWLSQRQSLLAQNVANSDTPGYAARDLEPLTFGKEAGGFSMALARTHAAHVQLGGREGAYRVRDQREPYETAPAKNGVVREEQMVKLGETQADHQLINNLYRKHVHMLHLALGRGGGQ